MKYKLQDLIDVKHFQELQDRLNKIYPFPSSIIDNDGNILTATAWQEICTKFHRKNKEAEKICIKSDQYIKDRIHEADPALSYRCPHGLVDNALPIIIDGVHYGNFFTGQFFLEKPDLTFFRTQAQKYGFNEADYLNAVKKVPIWTQEQLDDYLFFIKGLIDVIAESGLKKLKEIEHRKRIQKSEDRYRSILKAAMDGYWVTDTKCKLLEVNDAYSRMSGYNEDELLAMCISDLEAVETHERTIEHMKKVISEGSDRFETKHFHKNGTIFDVEVSIQFRADEDGRCICFIRDITEQKKAFEEIKTSNEKMKLAADSAKFGIWDLDIKTNQLKWDDWMFRLYGIDPNNFSGVYEAWQAGVHPEDIERSTNEVEKALRGEGDFDTEFRIVRPDGEVRYLKAYANVSSDNDGNPVHMTGINYDITDQKNAEIDLKESEFRFRSFVENANDIIYSLSHEGLFTYVSPNWLEFMGESAEAAIGKSFKQYVYEGDVQICQAFLDKVLTTGMKQSSPPYRVKHTEGELRWHISNGSPIKNANGNIVGYVGIARDVTVQKVAEDKLKRSEERFKSLLELFPGYIYLQSPDYSIRYTNQYFSNEFGNPEGRLCHEIFHGKSDPCDQCPTFKVFETKKPIIWARDNALNGKSYMLFDFPFRDSDGSELVLEFGMDITERKRTEKLLEESETFNRLTLSNIHDTVILTDDKGDFVFICPSVHFITGYSNDEVKKMGNIKKLIGKLDYDHEVFETQGSVQNIESEVVSKDGYKHNVLIGLKAIDFRNASRLYTIHDITEIKKIQKRLDQAQRMEAIGNLAGGIAHDFNNILFPILGFSHLMLEDLPPGSLEHENAQEIYRAGQRARDLINQILSFSRQTEHEMMSLKFQNVLKEVLKLCRATIPTNIEIEQNIQSDCGSVWADATQLHQIGMNLMTNAYHAVQDKNGKIIVDLKEVFFDEADASSYSLAPGRYALLSVTDNGIGMGDEIKSKVFDPYFTTKEIGKGTGLGLAVVYGIVKDFGGDIKVYSEPGIGTTFNVYLPLADKASDVKFSKEKIKIQTGHEHILLIDDELSIIRLVQLTLERLGYSVTSRVSSIEALEIFKKNPDKFDMIISDMSMPGMTGDQLAHEIKKIRPEIPIIICTGFSERINKEKAQEIGVDGFLMKPIVKSEVAATIRKIFDGTNKLA